MAVSRYTGTLVLHMVFQQINIQSIIWGQAIIGVSYTLIGGLSAVMRVDLIQDLVLMLGSAIPTVTAFDKTGG